MTNEDIDLLLDCLDALEQVDSMFKYNWELERDFRRCAAQVADAAHPIKQLRDKLYEQRA